MISGVVKWFDQAKGFGFITREDNGAEVFVHISEVERCGLSGLEQGQKVSLETGKGRNGFDAAYNLKIA
ncbi:MULTISPECIES: cold-shock protein [unclassified Lentilitoribacter]|jgi:CspA family cold shock protein|uniref:cold-shock protein n=1 Tax=unclassified Lentilitoribacter TaxID=2647570 RepID=UPI0013A6C87B|nr:cold-shock protein [Lentilitoribacter sp. Alg239-R112]